MKFESKNRGKKKSIQWNSFMNWMFQYKSLKLVIVFVYFSFTVSKSNSVVWIELFKKYSIFISLWLGILWTFLGSKRLSQFFLSSLLSRPEVLRLLSFFLLHLKSPALSLVPFLPISQTLPQHPTLLATALLHLKIRGPFIFKFLLFIIRQNGGIISDRDSMFWSSGFKPT